MGALVQFLPQIATTLKMGAQVGAGVSANRAAQAGAVQADAAALAIDASAQRTAEGQLHRSKLLQSRAQAVAAASGAGASDPSVLDIIGGIAGEGEYRSRLALAEGKSHAQAARYKGQVMRAEGRAAQTAGILNAGATLLSGAKSMFQKYGNGGPSGDDVDPEAFREWNDDNYFR